jgi:hypothetical protein
MTKAIALSILLRLGAPAPVAEDVAHSLALTNLSEPEAAFLLAWGAHESRYRERIIRNDCERWECDHGRARGAWQMHRGAAGGAWDALPGSVPLQVASAAHAARWALRTCGNPLGAFRLLGGLGCNGKLRGEEERVATYERIRRMR